MSDPKELLRMDEEAREKIRTRIDQNFFVEAGAGSGKTSCLVDRMTAMVESGIEVGQICAITFTKAAANEFYARFQSKLSERSLETTEGTTPGSRERCREALKNLDLCFMGTIDSFCYTILQEHPAEAGVPFSVSVRAEEEMKDIWKREFVRIQRGEYQDPELESLGRGFLLVQEKPEAAFLDCIGRLWRVRNGEIVFDYPEEIDWEGLLAPLQSEIVPLLEWVLDHEEWQTGIKEKAALKAFENLKKNMQVLKTPWSDNFGTVLKALKDIKNLRLSLDADVETGHRYAGKYFQVHLTRNRPAWYELWGKEDSDPEDYPYRKALDQLLGVQYRISMAFVTRSMENIEKELKRQGVLSFFDCLYTLRGMLREDVKREGRLIRHIAERHAFYLIDEFQDTNPMQAEIFFLLSAREPKTNWRECIPRPGSLFIVGDPKQSIYRFNQADIPAYRRVKALFTGEKGAVLYLTRNFRSTPKMTEWFNEQFSRILSVDSEDRCLFREIPRDEEETTKGFSGIFRYVSQAGKETPLERRDPYQVVEQIKSLVKNPDIIIWDRKDKKTRELSFGDVMVITSTKTSLGEISKELSMQQIPFRVEGKVVFRESPSFVAACDLFRYYGAPYDRYEKYRGTRILKDEEELEVLKKERLRMSHTALFRAILEEHRIFERFGTGNMEVTYYGLELLREAEQSGELPTRKEAIHFLEDLLEDRAKIERSISLEYDSDRVHLANLHKVKGLEAEAVILAKPSGQSHSPESRTEYMTSEPITYLFKSDGIQTSGFGEELEAEKQSLAAEKGRLLYVAATRARSVLVISEGLTEGGNASGSNPWLPLLEGVVHTLPERTEPLKLEAEAMDLEALTKEEGSGREWIEGGLSKEISYKILRPSKVTLKSRTASEDDYEDLADEEIRSREVRRDAALVGTLVHRLMEILVNSGNRVDRESAVEAILSEYGAQNDSYKELLLRVCDRIQKGGYEQEDGVPADILTELLDAEEVHCEVPFCHAEETEGIQTLWHGVMDVVYRKDGEWHILDYKTNAEAAELEEKYEGQLEAYQKAFKVMTGEKAGARIYHIDV